MKDRKPASESGIDRLLRLPILPRVKALPRKAVKVAPRKPARRPS
jgi:hypothetical protein